MDQTAFSQRIRDLEENMSEFLNQDEGDEMDGMDDMLSDQEMKMLFREMENNKGPISDLKKQVTEGGPQKVLNSDAIQATANALLANTKKSELEKKQNLEKSKMQKKLPKDTEKKVISKEDKKIGKIDKKIDEEDAKKLEKQKQLQRLGLTEKDVEKKSVKKDKPEESVLQLRMASKFQDIMSIFLNNYKDDDVREAVTIKYCYVEKSLREAHVKWEPNKPMKHRDMQTMNEKLKKISHLFGGKIEKTLELKYVPEISFYYDIQLDDKTADTSKLKKAGIVDPLATKKETAKMQPKWEEYNEEQKTFVNYDRKPARGGDRGGRGGYRGNSDRGGFGERSSGYQGRGGGFSRGRGGGGRGGYQSRGSEERPSGGGRGGYQSGGRGGNQSRGGGEGRGEGSYGGRGGEGSRGGFSSRGRGGGRGGRGGRGGGGDRERF